MAKTYAQKFAEKANKVQPKNLVIPFYTVKIGETIVGKLIGIESVQNEKIKEPCNRYIINTGEKEISILLGSATDKQLEGRLNIGWIVLFENTGKTPITGTNKVVNNWVVQQVEDE